jgi:hypothetical protein
MFDVFLSYLLGRFAEARAGSTGDSRNRNSEEYRAVFSQDVETHMPDGRQVIPHVGKY